ncbi:MAG: hypothetical protein ACI9UO_002077 [Nitrospinales bacterium]
MVHFYSATLVHFYSALDNGDTTVEFPTSFTSSYDKYVVEISELTTKTTDTGQLSLEFHNSIASWITSSYRWVSNNVNSSKLASVFNVGTFSDSNVMLTSLPISRDAVVGSTVSGTLKISAFVDPSANNAAKVDFNINYKDLANNGWNSDVGTGGIWSAHYDVDGFRLKLVSGTAFSGGKVSLYGYAN